MELYVGAISSTPGLIPVMSSSLPVMIRVPSSSDEKYQLTVLASFSVQMLQIDESHS